MIDFSSCHIVFVIETDSTAETDKRYISKFLQVHYNNLNSSVIKTHYVYLAGQGNFKKDETKKKIIDEINQIPNLKETYYKVVCCLDRDRINKDKKRNEEFCKFIELEGYEIVLFANNIENCFVYKIVGNKVETSKYFYANANKDKIPLELHNFTLEQCKVIKKGSNLNSVIKKITSKIKE